MLADDTLRHPMTLQARLVFQGEVDAVALRRALDRVTPRHPLLTAEPRCRRGRWVWTPQNRTVLLDVAPLGQPLACPVGVPIDLTREAGVRVWCRTAEGRTELTLQAHHACTDGMGILQFIFDVLADYHHQWHEAGEPGDGQAETTGSPAGDRRSPVDDRRRRGERTILPELLSKRDQFDFTPPEPVPRSTQVRYVVGESAKLLLRQPQRFRPAPPSSTPSRSQNPLTPPRSPDELPGLHALELSTETSAAYREAASAQGVMANDLLLRDMFLTLAQWSEQIGTPLPPRGWLRLTMPINVRTREHAKMSAANVISYAFITRRVEETRDPARLLASIHEETEAIKYWRMEGMFLGSVAAMQRVGLLRPLLRLPSCFSSLVLSNVGDVRYCAPRVLRRRDGRLVAGNLELESIVGAPPPRSKTHAAMVVSRYAGRITLGLQADTTIDGASAQAFLRLFANRLEKTARSAQSVAEVAETSDGKP